LPIFLLILIVLFVVMLLVAVILIALRLKESEAGLDEEARRKHPRGYWVSMGISIGAGLGVALGTAFGNLALGIAIGSAIGIAIGTTIEARKQDELRQTTENERRITRWVLVIGLIVGFVYLALFWMLARR
jgi:uncharacterized membrane protein YfcA